MRLPVAADLHINAFAGAGITELDSGVTNGIVEKRGEVVYLTQRPSIDISEDAGTHISDARGRGIFYWGDTSGLYIINNNKVYKGSQSNAIGTITAGTKKCKLLEIDDVLVLIDSENDQAFTISSGDVVAEITDTNFPPKQTPAVPLASGGAVLDNYLFVLGTNGTIYNSNLGDETTWGALDYLNAEREPDGGVYLGKHHDNIVAYGNTTVEFFYDAANTAGSPLSRRQDIAFNIGCASGESVWEEGDRAFFIGVNFSGALGVYTLEQFQPRKISTPSIDSFLTQAMVKDGFAVMGSGLSAQGHIFYILTIYTTPSDIVPDITLVYDDTTALWGEWETSINDITKFPLVAWTKRQDADRYGEGVLVNGDIISLNDDLLPQDTLLASIYVDDGYIDDGYITESGAVGTSITMKSRTGMFDGGTTEYKYPTGLRVIANSMSQDVTVRWADEENVFNAGYTLDLSTKDKLTRLGRFERRNFEVEYSGDASIKLEGVEVHV